MYEQVDYPTWPGYLTYTRGPHPHVNSLLLTLLDKYKYLYLYIYRPLVTQRFFFMMADGKACSFGVYQDNGNRAADRAEQTSRRADWGRC